MNLFQSTLEMKNSGRPPVWFMRQAGRYHQHYQDLKKEHTFLDICKKPEVSCEAAMGPIRDFDFDASILFSDILFPLELMGMGLDYKPGPQMDWHFTKLEDKSRFNTDLDANKLDFQRKALELLRKELPESKGMIGFIGGPLTLFFYAAVGSHKNDLENARLGLSDGRYDFFNEHMIELLAQNMALQAKAGPDVIAILDTCAGDVSLDQFKNQVIPVNEALVKRFRELSPDTRVLYYSKGTGPEHWRLLRDLPIEGIGVDWNHPIDKVIDEFSERFVVQGNFDPHKMLLTGDEFKQELNHFFDAPSKLPQDKLKSWVCGLGHGILKDTPEENVVSFIKKQREVFG